MDKARGLKTIELAAQLQQRSVARGDVAKVPDMSNAEAIGLVAYVATIPGTGVRPWFDVYANCTTAGGQQALAAAVARAYQFGYLRALDDIQTERIAV